MVNWFFLFNISDLPPVVATELTLQLEGVGEKTILVTIGNHLGLTVDDVFLSLGSAEVEDYAEIDGVIGHKDEDGNVWLGFEQ